MKRREFIKSLSLSASAIMVGCAKEQKPAGDRLGELLPQRLFGNTGEKVTMLGLGGYHIGWTTERDAQETIEAALEGGIRFFDSAESYGPHPSEKRYGKFLTPALKTASSTCSSRRRNRAKCVTSVLPGTATPRRTAACWSAQRR